MVLRKTQAGVESFLGMRKRAVVELKGAGRGGCGAQGCIETVFGG